MLKKIYDRFRAIDCRLWFYPVWICVCLFVFINSLANNKSLLTFYACLLVLVIFAVRPKSSLHIADFETKSILKPLITLTVAISTVFICIEPMDQLSLWNGEQPGHRNQYELMAEAILEGRIDFNYGDEDELLSLENPYDPDERKESGVKYHWDHAYYNGHYYMYFGIVPVFLAFLPYRIVTGQALTTYKATQLFAALAIIGIFVLFYQLYKAFFRKLPYSVYLTLSVAFSVLSIWYSMAEPALYCTPITAAIMLEVWSISFFVRAVYGNHSENKSIALAGVGALLGALAFGCRPPIALANIVVLPLLIAFIKQRKINFKLILKLVGAAMPYVIIGVALMAYNYVRFDNPFEFGQSYQLTVADQSAYEVSLNKESLLRIINDGLSNFVAIKSIKDAFPYIKTSSVFFNFPILLICFVGFKSSVAKKMREHKILGLAIGLACATLIITVMDILWTPYLLERYRMDIYFLMGILCFIVIGAWYESSDDTVRRRISTIATTMGVLTVVSAFLLYVATVGNYYPDNVPMIAKDLGL